MFGVTVMRFRFKIYSGLGFRIGIFVWDSGLGFRFGMQSLGFGFKILVLDLGLRFRFDNQVWNKI